MANSDLKYRSESNSIMRVGLIILSMFFAAALSGCGSDGPTPVPTFTDGSASSLPDPTEAPNLMVGPEIGNLAPEFELTNVDEEVLALSDLLGNRPFILYFFATW